MNDKEKILQERMSECCVTKDDILDCIRKTTNKKMSVLVYISRFEGLGNKDSDFDIYAICREDICHPIEMLQINEVCFDIEYWPLEKLEKLVDNIDSITDRDQLKLIKRIHESVLLTEEVELTTLVRKIDAIDIDNKIYKYFKRLVNAEYDDALKMDNNAEYISCLSCCQRAGLNLIAAINAKNGHSNLNHKWTNKIFIDNSGYDKELYEEYLNTYIYISINKENIRSIIERMLDFISNYRNFSFF